MRDHSYINIPTFSLVLSIALHVIPLLFLTVAQILHLTQMQMVPTKETKKELYQSFIQVDVVALPDFKPKTDYIDPTAQVSSKPSKKVTIPIPEEKDVIQLPPKKKAKIKTKPKKKKKANLANQRAKALKKLEEEVSRQSAIAALAEQARRRKLKGNLISKGTSAKGKIGTMRDAYLARITQRIKSNFTIYEWHKKQKLVSKLKFNIDPTGKVGKIKVLQSSGNSSYENAVKQAIKASEPLPVPKDMSILKGGITIEFNATQDE